MVSFCYSIARKVTKHTLNEAEYGIPIGRLVTIAKSRFARADLNAKLCEISWMARKRFWLAVAPMM